jgi:hypothetical protein
MYDFCGKRLAGSAHHSCNGLRKFAVRVASQNQFDADATVVSARNV